MRIPKSCLFLILLSLLSVNVVLAIEPELMLEKPVEGKRVLGNFAGGNLILASPEGIRTLSATGTEISQSALASNQGLASSGDGKFFGITTFSENTPSGFLGADKFELYSADGTKIWEASRPPVADFYVSNQANWIVGVANGGDGPQSSLIFYNHAGDSVSSIKIGFLQGIFFSSDGKRIFVNSAKDGLISFGSNMDSTTGSLETINYGPCDNFAASSSGENVVTFSQGSFNFFYRGNQTGSYSHPDILVRKMALSPEGKYLAFLDKKNLYLLETSTGKLLWQYILDKPELSFVSLDVTGNANRIIVGVDFDKGKKEVPEDRHTNGFVYLLDRSGKTVWTREFTYKLWGANFPKAQFSSDGTDFSVLTREKVYLFKNNQ
jgi:hypothetical protein